MTAPERCPRCGLPRAATFEEWYDGDDLCGAGVAVNTREQAFRMDRACYRVAFERERDLRRRLREAVTRAALHDAGKDERRDALQRWEAADAALARVTAELQEAKRQAESNQRRREEMWAAWQETKKQLAQADLAAHILSDEVDARDRQLAEARGLLAKATRFSLPDGGSIELRHDGKWNVWTGAPWTQPRKRVRCDMPSFEAAFEWWQREHGKSEAAP